YMAGGLMIASTNNSGTLGNNWSGEANLSATGRYVTYSSSANNLVAGDSNGNDDIFIKDTLTGTTTLISKSTNGNLGNQDYEFSSVSADGRFVVYQSTATNLVSGDTNGVRDIFWHDTQTGETRRISQS